MIPQADFIEREGQKVVLALAGTDNFKRVRVNDFVISLRSFQGGIEHSAFDGAITPAYTVLRPSQDVQVDYFRYVLKSAGFISALNATTEGIRDGKAVPYESFGELKLPVPPPDEQRRIAAFLDYEITRIDELVQEQERLLELAHEKHIAFIQATLSGQALAASTRHEARAPWLDAVPSSWDIVPLRFLARISTGSRDTQDRVEDGQYPFFVRSMTVERIDTYSYDTEAVLTSGDGAGVGEVFHHVTEAFELHQRMYALTDFKRVTGRYLFFFLRAYFKLQMTQWNAKSTVDSVRLPFLQALLVAAPPAAMQQAISTLLDNREREHVALTEEVRRITDLLRERRSALITAAVTGQIDVNTWTPPDDWLSTETT